MSLLLFLIAFPLLTAFLLVIIRQNTARNVIVIASSLITAVASVSLVVTYINSGAVFFECVSPVADTLCTIVSAVCVFVVIAYAAKYKNILAGAMAIVQIVLVLWIELGFAHEMEVTNGLYVDSLGLLMTLIIGIIGTGICVYAIGYMQDFQKHEPEDAKDRRPLFFALMFIFLSAMYVIVFSNNLSWMFTGWEITTICSFLLIGYTKTEEAIRNAFRQIVMNLAGGIAFIAALGLCITQMNTLSFIEFIRIACASPDVAVVPVVLLAFAGTTKAAQMPFQTWLLGAMVAPTPTSALLHSSTMVKAGVFMLVKLAPCMLVSAIPSTMVILVGGITFLLCSFMAISQSNAKRVLAYSTIANLGLITACAGVGSPEAVWAATFLILFHAIAKSLLFLCVGTAEHHIGSRDIEDMDLLFERMPRLSRYMLLGIMCMFIAPFGMLIAKWATLVSFVEMHQIALILILAFGSAATFMFWAKWMGKLAGIAGSPENVELTVSRSEWASILLMAILLVVCCALIPVVSYFFVAPYILEVYGSVGQDLNSSDLWIASICVVAVVIVLFAGIGRSRKKQVDIYLSGINVENDTRTFTNSLSGQTVATARNWYLDSIFGESQLASAGVICNSVLMAAAICFSIVGSFAL